MSPNFIGLARELRDKIYRNLLVCGEDVVLNQAWSCPALAVQILRTNRKIHDEATQVLYGQNRFDYCHNQREPELEASRLVSLLERIGPINALFIRHVRIDFPHATIHSKESGDVQGFYTEEDKLFDALRKNCGNLRKVTMSRLSVEYHARYLNLVRPGFRVGVFDLIEARIRAIRARKDGQEQGQDNEVMIVVEANAATVEDEATTEMRQEMTKRGWVLDAVEVVEEGYMGRRYGSGW